MPSKVVPAYLLIYNVAQSVGWAIILVETISALWVQQKTGNEQNVYGEVGWLVGKMLFKDDDSGSHWLEGITICVPKRNMLAKS